MRALNWHMITLGCERPCARLDGLLHVPIANITETQALGSLIGPECPFWGFRP
jgi:hypothetical protein